MTRWHAHPVSDPGLWLFLLWAVVGGAAFIAAVTVGQHAMCAAYEDRPSPPPYCEQAEK